MIAFEHKRELQDAQFWDMGQYVVSALNATIMNVFRKENTEKQTYIEKPIHHKSRASETKELTEEEIIKKTQELFAQLEVKAINEKRQKRFMEKQGEVE